MPSALIGDLDMFYRVQGRGDPVVLIHGNTASSLWWEYTLQRMGETYRFIAPDLRGRGDTEGPAAQWTIKTLSDDVRGLVESLGTRLARMSPCNTLSIIAPA
jgi:pimeloyl-ACP methyl ester carboxylesterase